MIRWWFYNPGCDNIKYRSSWLLWIVYLFQPQFIHLSQLWSGFQDEMVLLSVLSNICEFPIYFSLSLFTCLSCEFPIYFSPSLFTCLSCEFPIYFSLSLFTCLSCEFPICFSPSLFTCLNCGVVSRMRWYYLVFSAIFLPVWIHLPG